MVVCGISGRRRQAAAAIAVDGRLVAATEQAPLARTGTDERSGRLPFEAIHACVEAAGLSARDISTIVRADGYAASMSRSSPYGGGGDLGGKPVPIHRLSRLGAFARLARATGAATVVVADGAAAMVVQPDGTPRELPRASGLLTLACRLAAELGLAHDDAARAIEALEQLAAPQAPSGCAWFETLAAPETGSVAGDVVGFDRALQIAAAEAGAPLSDASTPHVRRARAVAEAASGFLTAVASHFAHAAASSPTGAMLAGSVFGSPDFAARVQRAAEAPCLVAPCPSQHGAALGAALADDGTKPGVMLPGLALGPTADEADAKAVLENCRLDYVYEPRWPRLLERVSRVLERGKLVAWFQGRAEFGLPLCGSRSFLCDPSNRYARDNINVFLRRQPLSAPIPLSLSPMAGAQVESFRLSPWTVSRILIAPEWRDAMRAGVDAHGYAHVHAPQSGEGPFADLLTLHQQRTGVPALANLPLRAPDDVAAISPRDAVRAAFASSADALIIHRFVVMKDYWQMRDAEF